MARTVPPHRSDDSSIQRQELGPTQAISERRGVTLGPRGRELAALHCGGLEELASPHYDAITSPPGCSVRRRSSSPYRPHLHRQAEQSRDSGRQAGIPSYRTTSPSGRAASPSDRAVRSQHHHNLKGGPFSGKKGKTPTSAVAGDFEDLDVEY